MLLDKIIEKDCVTDWCPECRHNGVLGSSHICKGCFIVANSETGHRPTNYIPINTDKIAINSVYGVTSDGGKQ